MTSSKLDWERVRLEELCATKGTERFSADRTIETRRIGSFCTYCRSKIEKVKGDFIRQHWRVCEAFKEDRQARATAKEARRRDKKLKEKRSRNGQRSVSTGRPDYKTLHEMARKALGENCTTTAFRKWKKGLPVSVLTSLGFTPEGRPPPFSDKEKAAFDIARHDRKAFGNDQRIFLISKRGTRLSEPHECDECSVRRQVFRYSRSSIGTVHICAACKPKVFGRSFGRVDAMNLTYQGGGFETKRRKF